MLADGTRVGVPWTWGSIGITYDSDVVDDRADVVVRAARAEVEGQGRAARRPDRLARAGGARPRHRPGRGAEGRARPRSRTCLKQIIAQSRGVAPSFGDLATQLVAGDVAITWQGWAAMNSASRPPPARTRSRPSCRRRAAFSFCDAYALPKGADNADTTYSWINEVLDPQVNADAAVVPRRRRHGDRARPSCSTTRRAASTRTRTWTACSSGRRFYGNPPRESDEFVTFDEWQAKWQEIKAGA